MSDREENLDAEIQDYLERETRENTEAGMSPEQARHVALRKLGPVLRVKEDTRAAWGWAWLARLSQDLRYGVRMLRQNPGFSFIAILSIALGVGANCAMFSAADALVLRPLPVPHPDGVIHVNSVTSSFFNTSAGSYPDYVSLRDSVRGFRGLAALDFLPIGISTQPNALPQLKMAAMVSGNFFDVLEVTPLLGRAFRPDEDQAPGRDAVAVLSYGVWQEQFSGDRGVLGRKIRLNGIEFTVVGVAPERFTGIEPFMRTAAYVPLAMYPRLSGDARVLEARDHRSFRLMGRLRLGVTMAQAQAEVSAIGAKLAQAYPETDRNRLLVLRTELQRRLQDDPIDAQLVFTLLGLAAAVLCVACANVAGLLTSRAPVRAREMALRLAIGAGRGRLIRQLLTESALLAVLGGLLGMGVGYSGILLFQQIQLPTDLVTFAYLGLDRRVFVATLAATALSAVLFGLIPAIRTARADLAGALKARDAAPPGRARFWGRGLLVSGQIAVALLLLTATTFFYRGVGYSLSKGPGSRTDHLMMMSVAPNLQNYDDAKMQRFYDRLVEEAGQLSGAKSAALASAVPLKNTQNSMDIVPEGHHFPPGVDRAQILSNRIDEHYFEVMGIPIVEGRGFQRTDTLQSPRVAVVNQNLARHYWPNQDPIGKRLRIDGPNGPWVEIAGIAKNTKYSWIGEAPMDFIYLAERQNPSRAMTLLVESMGDSASLAAPLRELIRGLDADMPIFDVLTMDAMYQMRAVRTSHIIVAAVAGMGAMGLLLALVGLYGLAAYAVNRRTKEFGIRMAVGAKPSSVLRMVLRQSALLAIFGVAAGMPLAIGLGRVLRAGFPEGDADPAHSALLAMALFAITLIAAYVPARRASRVDPTIALRDE
jgi:predicted permease